MSRLKVILTADEISAAVRTMASRISHDYRDKTPLLLGVLKGCFVFMADLSRNLEIPVEIEFVILSSYGPGRKTTTGTVAVVQGLRCDVKDRDVLVVKLFK